MPSCRLSPAAWPLVASPSRDNAGGALRRSGALLRALRRLSAVPRAGVRRDAQPRALRAAGLRGSSSSAPTQDFARVRLTCGAVTSAIFSTRRAAWPFAVSVIPRPSPCASLRFARFAGLRRARCFPAPTEVSARRLPLRRRGVLPASPCFGRPMRTPRRLIRLSRLRRPRRRL